MMSNKAILKVVDIYGGIDIMVSNAGAAWQGEIGKVNSAVLKESFDLNFYAHQYLSQACIDIMLKQQTGGVLLFNITNKQLIQEITLVLTAYQKHRLYF